ncbi:Altronate dehydratase [termite gut metagenome]|uniref:Altronate dehydratase n=1 Tax=termite gut metagenome TaxID=433724 RepID=A0A5J4T316_9ZZZZ
MKRLLRINQADNVAIVLDKLHAGENVDVDGREIFICEEVDNGHKFALTDIKKGEYVIKYGYPIGYALTDILSGSWVHVHNLKTNLKDKLEYTYHPVKSSHSFVNPELKVHGYLRANGQMGIRNELWVVPSVGCVNGQAQAIADQVKKKLDIAHVDDVRVYTHTYGCSQLGEDHENLQKVLAGLIKHPNAGGILVLGLGCENNQIADLKQVIGEWDEERVKFLIAQEVADEVETGFEIVKELIGKMKSDKREELPLSLLKVGLKCGGSDGFSGITANPLVGVFSDWLIAQGGTAILTEVPEMFGAETILMDRACSPEVFYETVRLINNFKEYFRKFDQPVYENPSPGNKKGGITTLEEKSLGCVQKGGTAEVTDVLSYAQPVAKTGLNLLQAPGNDLVATSALAVSGCHIVLFTTGRGTPFGSFVPTMKISTNSALYHHKTNWIDFNAGTLLENEDMAAVSKRFVTFVLEVVNGRKLKHEVTGFKEIAFFKTGVIL